MPVTEDEYNALRAQLPPEERGKIFDDFNAYRDYEKLLSRLQDNVPPAHLERLKSTALYQKFQTTQKLVADAAAQAAGAQRVTADMLQSPDVRALIEEYERQHAPQQKPAPGPSGALQAARERFTQAHAGERHADGTPYLGPDGRPTVGPTGYEATARESMEVHQARGRRKEEARLHTAPEGNSPEPEGLRQAREAARAPQATQGPGRPGGAETPPAAAPPLAGRIKQALNERKLHYDQSLNDPAELLDSALAQNKGRDVGEAVAPLGKEIAASGGVREGVKARVAAAIRLADSAPTAAAAGQKGNQPAAAAPGEPEKPGVARRAVAEGVPAAGGRPHAVPEAALQTIVPGSPQAQELAKARDAILTQKAGPAKPDPAASTPTPGGRPHAVPEEALQTIVPGSPQAREFEKARDAILKRQAARGNRDLQEREGRPGRPGADHERHLTGSTRDRSANPSDGPPSLTPADRAAMKAMLAEDAARAAADRPGGGPSPTPAGGASPAGAETPHAAGTPPAPPASSTPPAVSPEVRPAGTTPPPTPAAAHPVAETVPAALGERPAGAPLPELGPGGRAGSVASAGAAGFNIGTGILQIREGVNHNDRGQVALGGAQVATGATELGTHLLEATGKVKVPTALSGAVGKANVLIQVGDIAYQTSQETGATHKTERAVAGTTTALASVGASSLATAALTAGGVTAAAAAGSTVAAVAVVAAPIVVGTAAAVAVGYATEQIIETRRVYEEEDKRFTARLEGAQAFQHITAVSNSSAIQARVQQLALAEGLNYKDQADKAHPPLLDRSGRLDFSHPEAARLLHQAIREQIAEKDQTIGDLGRYLPRYNPFANRKTVDAYNLARSDKAALTAARDELEQGYTAVAKGRADTRHAYEHQLEALSGQFHQEGEGLVKQAQEAALDARELSLAADSLAEKAQRLTGNEPPPVYLLQEAQGPDGKPQRNAKGEPVLEAVKDANGKPALASQRLGEMEAAIRVREKEATRLLEERVGRKYDDPAADARAEAAWRDLQQLKLDKERLASWTAKQGIVQSAQALDAYHKETLALLDKEQGLDRKEVEAAAAHDAGLQIVAERYNELAKAHAEHPSAYLAEKLVAAQVDLIQAEREFYEHRIKQQKKQQSGPPQADQGPEAGRDSHHEGPKKVTVTTEDAIRMAASGQMTPTDAFAKAHAEAIEAERHRPAQAEHAAAEKKAGPTHDDPDAPARRSSPPTGRSNGNARSVGGDAHLAATQDPGVNKAPQQTKVVQGPAVHVQDGERVAGPTVGGGQGRGAGTGRT